MRLPFPGTGGRSLFVAALVLALACPFTSAPAPAAAQTADINAEARVFFERGNRHFEDGMARRGRRRQQALEQALEAYVSSLRIVRSRNALFNAAAVLVELGRRDEAFAYYAEYLAIPGLSEAERAAGEERVGPLRTQVALVRVTSEPAGAEVFVDRLDLAARGRTPLELALPPGEHTVFFRLPHHSEEQARTTAVTGEVVTATAALRPNPRPLDVTLPGPGRLLVDGQPAAPDARLTPGVHVLTFVPEEGRPVERRLEVEVGEGPVELVFRASQEGPRRATILVRSPVAASVSLDGVSVGSGTEVRVPTTPGDHVVVVEASGYVAAQQRVMLEAGQSATMDVELTPVGTETTLGAAPAWVALASIGVGLTGTAFGIRALRKKADYNSFTEDCCRTPGDFQLARAYANDVDRANHVADGILGTALLLGITTIILFAVDEPLEQEPSRATLSFAPTRGGAMVGASLALEGL